MAYVLCQQVESPSDGNFDFFSFWGEDEQEEEGGADIYEVATKRARCSDKYNIMDSLEKQMSRDKRKSLSRKHRMLVSDVRGMHAKMLTNVSNSGDASLIMGLFKYYYSPNVSLNFRKYTPSKDPIFEISYQGYRLLTNFWFTLMNLSCDTVFTLRNEREVTQGTKNSLEMSVLYSSTKAYNIESFHDVLPNMVVGESCDMSQCDDIMYASLLESTLETVKSKLVLREKPIPIMFEGKLVLYFDEENRVKNMSLKVRSVKNCFSESSVEIVSSVLRNEYTVAFDMVFVMW